MARVPLVLLTRLPSEGQSILGRLSNHFDDITALIEAGLHIYCVSQSGLLFKNVLLCESCTLFKKVTRDKKCYGLA